jgi:hypothetical protein
MGLSIRRVTSKFYCWMPTTGLLLRSGELAEAKHQHVLATSEYSPLSFRFRFIDQHTGWNVIDEDQKCKGFFMEARVGIETERGIENTQVVDFTRRPTC